MVALLEQLFALEADFTPAPQRQRLGLACLLDARSARVWVAIVDRAVVGMCTVQVLVSTAEGGSVGLIEDVVVDEAHRGRGIGRALLAQAEAWAADAGLTRLQLLADVANATALRFYAKHGWSTTQLVALRKRLA